MHHTDDRTRHIPNEPSLQNGPDRPQSLTLRIPKPNWQVTALILIALIAGFQTVQLVRLKGTVAQQASAATTTTSTSTTPASSDAGLQSQVGGC